MVMIAQCHAQNLLRFVLFDDETVEKRFHIARLLIELKERGLLLDFCSIRWRRLLPSVFGEEHRIVLKILFHEVLELLLKVFRRRWSVESARVHVDWGKLAQIGYSRKGKWKH